MRTAFKGNTLIINLESEGDLLAVAEFLQRRKGQPVRNHIPASRTMTTKTEIAAKVHGVLKSGFPSGRFSRNQAEKLVKKEIGLGRTSTANYLRDLTESGSLHKVDRAIYSFDSGALQAPDPDSPLLLRCSKPEILLDVLRVVKALSEKVVLAFSKEGVHCILSDSQGHMALHVRMSKDLFAAYHLKDPLQIEAYSEAILERGQRSGNDIILSIKDGKLAIGQYNLSANIMRAEAPELEQPEQYFKSELVIPREELVRILQDCRVNSEYVDIIAADTLTLQSFNEGGDFKREITTGYSFKEPTRCRLYYLDHLIKCLRASKCDTVKVGINGNFVVTDFQIDSAVKVSLFLACKPLEESRVAV